MIEVFAPEADWPVILKGGHYSLEDIQPKYPDKIGAVDHLWLKFQVLSEFDTMLFGLDCQDIKSPYHGFTIHENKPKGVVAKATGVWFE